MARLGWWLLSFGMVVVACSGRSERNNSAPARTPCENTLDCAAGQVCGREQGYCAECFRDGDCDSGGCVNEVCRSQCVSDKDCAEGGQLCDFGRNLCVDCVDDGDCPESDYCGDSACRSDDCVPGATRCTETNVVATCASNGSFSEIEVCSGACIENDGVAWCVSRLCDPNSFFCDGDEGRVMQCSEDGLSSDLFDDCLAKDEVCLAGECSERVCDPEERVCDGWRIMECVASGARFDVVDACAEDSYCEPESVTCVAGKCTPGEKACSSGGVVTCEVDGSVFGDRVACGADQVCLQGACVPEVCEAETSFCYGGHPWECDESGKVTDRADTCTSLEYCDDETGSCETKVCTENSLTCVGNTLQVCDALGSSYTEQDCDDGDVCEVGQCWPMICEPNTYYCEGGNPHQCFGKGSSSIILDSCTELEICEVNGDGTSASCVLAGSGAGGEGG